MNNKFRILALASSLILVSCSQQMKQEDLTRGIGVYPGAPSEYFGPTESKADDSYRNLALRRAAWHSSSYDYNLTAQLATDGIVESEMPCIMTAMSQDGPIAKRERERLFDDNITTVAIKGGKDAFLEVKLSGGEGIVADHVSLNGSFVCDLDAPKGYNIDVQITTDGQTWETVSSLKGKDLPGKAQLEKIPAFAAKAIQAAQAGSQNVSVAAGLGGVAISESTIQQYLQMMRTRNFEFSANLPTDKPIVGIRFNLGVEASTDWTLKEMDLELNGKEVSPLPSYQFRSAWMSEGLTDEWLYVDLGDQASFDKVSLFWINKPSSGVVEVSSDAKTWKEIASIPSDDSTVDNIDVKAKGRYVRISKLESSSNIVLSEIQVWGRGGKVAKAAPALKENGNRLYLSGGNWTLQRSSLVNGEGSDISTVGYDAKDWVIATVPSTVASSYYNVGAIPDIRYDDDQLQISESFFLSDFWYRDEFTLPESFSGKPLVLNFDGINWKADIYFNSEYIGHIDGAFIRGKFDVTSLAKPGVNALAVKIYKNDNPGVIKEQTAITADTNGGVLGADNPTMHCAIGWDWIPTVRGRNIGIWNDVFLSCYEGGVSIDDVFVNTDLPLPSTDYADLTPTVTLTNNTSEDKTALVELVYGDTPITAEVLVPASKTIDAVLPTTRLSSPNLWWPNGYGDHYLYDVKTTVKVAGVVSDTKQQKSGVREMSYKEDGQALDIYVNGRRLIGNGGNWGYPEINLNYRAREYETAVAYHADMNYTMIRDWVGQTGDEEFYEACDRHGIMVWQDFWLANPWDGPDPDNNSMFMKNAEDYVRKIRNHPSLAIYVGRNEGYPPKELNDALENLVKDLHPGMFYIPHSAEGYVSGNGPYRALPVEEYFNAIRGRDKLHSERGMPNVMTYESITRMLREENYWPQTSVWGVHDYTMENAQSCATFNEMIETAFSQPKDLKEFSSWAQWINYNGYRAMYESRSWNRKGLLIWMSHSCWPSMVWQTYDYYFEPTAAYFGVKKASAPIRIQWNPVTRNVEVVNNNAGDQNGLSAYAAILNYDGTLVWEDTVSLDAKEDTTNPVFTPAIDDMNMSDTYYIKLKLCKGDEVIADNFYWEDKNGNGEYKQLLSLPEVNLDVTKKVTLDNGQYCMEVSVKNNTSTPALMVRFHVQGKTTGESIVPAMYEDNFFSLLPSESKTVKITFKQEDTRNEKPQLVVEGFNVK